MIERAEFPVHRKSTFSGGLSRSGIAREAVGIVREERVYVEIGQIVAHFGAHVSEPRSRASGRERVRGHGQACVMRHAHDTRLAFEENFRRSDPGCECCNLGEALAREPAWTITDLDEEGARHVWKLLRQLAQRTLVERLHDDEI